MYGFLDINPIQDDQLNIVGCFLYLLKSEFSSLHVYRSVRTLDQSLFTRYQKNNWSPFSIIPVSSINSNKVARVVKGMK